VHRQDQPHIAGNVEAVRTSGAKSEMCEN
jgi:hypothetical protein